MNFVKNATNVTNVTNDTNVSNTNKQTQKITKPVDKNKKQYREKKLNKKNTNFIFDKDRFVLYNGGQIKFELFNDSVVYIKSNNA